MLGRDDRLDDVGDIVYVGQGFDAEENIVKGLLGRMGGIFGSSNNCKHGSVRCPWQRRVCKLTRVGLEALVTVEG